MFICMLREMFPIFDDGWCSLGSASSIQCVGSLLVTTMHWIFRRKWFRWVNWLSRKTVWHCWYYRPPLRCAGMRWHLLVWPVHGQCGPSLPESLHRHLSEVESRSNQSLATWHWHPDSYTPIGSKYYIKNFTIKILPETDEELFERQRLLRYTVDRQKFISDKKALIATST